MNKELIINNDPKSPVSEAFRALRTNMQYLKHDCKQQTIVTTSTVQGEGKTWITVNLAIAFAQLGKKTLLIDSDMRVPRVHKIFEMDQYPGLSNYLSKISQTGRNEEYTLNNILKYSDIKNLALVLAGSIPPNPSELLSSNRLQELIDEAKEKFDVIIFDGTPCLLVTDAIIISRIVDSTIIVTSKRKTKLDDLKEVKKRIENAGGHIVGVILNRVKESSKKYESKYYYSSDKKSKKHHSKYNYGKHSDIFDENEEIKRELQSEFHNEVEEDSNILNIMDGPKTNRFGGIIQDENLINLDEFDSHEEDNVVQLKEEPKVTEEIVTEKIEIEETIKEEPIIEKPIVEKTIKTSKPKKEEPKKVETKKAETKKAEPKKAKEEKEVKVKKETKKEKEIKPKKEAKNEPKEKKTAAKTKVEKETKKVEPVKKKAETKAVKEKPKKETKAKAEPKKKEEVAKPKKKEIVAKPVKKKETVKPIKKEVVVKPQKKEEPVKPIKKSVAVKKKITAKEVIQKELKNKEPIKKEPKKKVAVKEVKKETVKKTAEKKTATKTVTKKPVKRAEPKRFKEPEEKVAPRKTLGKKILDLFTEEVDEEVDEEEAKRR